MTQADVLPSPPIIAVARGVPEGAALETAEALAAGGVRWIEVTLNTPGALEVLASWRERFAGRLTVGAGTVTDLAGAREALAAGAEFLVTPNLDEAVIARAREVGVPIYPGALTPSEIVRAHAAGASAVKVFPVNALGGARYLRDVLTPLGHIPLIAVGGVNAENARGYLEAGARAVGLGGALVDLGLIRAGHFAALTERARACVAAVEGARA